MLGFFPFEYRPKKLPHKQYGSLRKSVESGECIHSSLRRTVAPHLNRIAVALFGVDMFLGVHSTSIKESGGTHGHHKIERCRFNHPKQGHMMRSFQSRSRGCCTQLCGSRYTQKHLALLHIILPFSFPHVFVTFLSTLSHLGDPRLGDLLKLPPYSRRKTPPA